MSRDIVITMIFLATMLILTIVFACVAKHNRRRNWYLVQKKYVRASTEHLVFVVRERPFLDDFYWFGTLPPIIDFANYAKPSD